MSLPNPKQYVTEERLNEYHNIILPFLGGMPDILANKFARGDMYSTDEKIIGQWIDGKPLYQKTITIIPSNYASGSNYNIPSSVTGLTNYNTISHEIRDDYSECYGNSGVCSVRGSDSMLIITSLSLNYPNINHNLTLQYTKTTDSSVEIGNDTDYSTTEKIVGTWIDGKPLYQKTISVEIPLNTKSGGGFYAAFEPLISNIIPIRCNVVGYQGSSKGYTCSDVALRIDASNGRWFLYCINDITMVTSITVQYTKTTD